MADRYISERALIEEVAKIKDLRRLSSKTIGEAISNTPTANVVEVVRCKDCTAFLSDTDYCKIYGKGYCKYDGAIKPQQHFCGYGERRKENVNRN